MRALLLAAGFGTRLRPLTDRVPKCLVPIRGRPLLGYWLDLLGSAGVEPLIVNLHYLPEQVEAYLAASPHRERVVAVYEPELLGTGGTVLANRELLAGGPFLVVHADNLSRFDVRMFQQAHRSRPQGCEISMLTFDTDTPESCGVVELDARGVVNAFHEKVAHPPTRLANGAVYVMEPSIFGFLERLGKRRIDLSTEVLPHYLGRILAFKNDTYHRDIGTTEAYARAQVEDGYLAAKGTEVSHE